MNYIINPQELAHFNSKRNKTGEILGCLANLSQATGLKDLFIHHEVLPPGHRSSPAHAHSQKEEFVYVLKGMVSTWIDGQWHDINAGMCVGFPPLIPHMVRNNSAEDAELLVISTLLHNEDTITFCPDDSIGMHTN